MTTGRRFATCTLLAAAGLVLAGCPSPGGPASPDPVRFLLEGDPPPCRIVYGPVRPDLFYQFDEVATVGAPAGETHILSGFVVADHDAPDLEVDGVGVWESSNGDRTEVFWSSGSGSVGFSTPSLDRDEVRALLPVLVDTPTVPALADELAERIDDAEVRYAGPTPQYDVGISYDEATLSIAGRGASDAQVDALYSVFGDDAEQVAGEWRTEIFAATESRARDATIIVGSDRAREPVDGDAFADVVGDLMADGEPIVAVSGGRATTAGYGCEAPGDGAVDAAIGEVSVIDSDIGALLRITFDGLPDDGSDHRDPRLVHVGIGDVELVAPYDGEPVVEFPAALTHAEAQLVAERLAP